MLRRVQGRARDVTLIVVRDSYRGETCRQFGGAASCPTGSVCLARAAHGREIHQSFTFKSKCEAEERFFLSCCCCRDINEPVQVGRSLIAGRNKKDEPGEVEQSHSELLKLVMTG